MQKEKHVSFLDNKVNHKEKMWCPIKSAIYENDTIELKFACHYISQERLIKPINLELGEKNLYKIIGGIPKGKVSLNFTTMTLKDQDSQYIFHLQKNNKILGIVVQNVEQIKQVLGKKCILNTFHEDYQIDKIIQNGNKNQGYFIAFKIYQKGWKKITFFKISKFCTQMEEFKINSPLSMKKDSEESLFKIAIKNSLVNKNPAQMIMMRAQNKKQPQRKVTHQISDSNDYLQNLILQIIIFYNYFKWYSYINFQFCFVLLEISFIQQNYIVSIFNLYNFFYKKHLQKQQAFKFQNNRNIIGFIIYYQIKVHY